MEKIPPLVSIICTAYNHERYIREALNGFVMQKTDFRFEILISDDASTDNTAKIIKEYENKYPELFIAFYHEKNLYSKGIPFFVEELLPNAKGKYIALCDGDDYWTDPNKLQKQVDFLEANDDFSICFHAVKIKNEQKNSVTNDHSIRKVSDISNIYNLAKNNYIPSVSVVFRKNRNVFESFAALGDIPIVDYVLHILNARNGKIKKLSKRMAVYRIGVGAWSSQKASYRIPFLLNLLDKLIVLLSNDEKLIHILKQQYRTKSFALYNIYEKEKDITSAKILFMKICVKYPDLVYDEFKKRASILYSIKNSKICRFGSVILKYFRF